LSNRSWFVMSMGSFRDRKIAPLAAAKRDRKVLQLSG
jgi:hypothetical protein